jgi:hypothetical protein
MPGNNGGILFYPESAQGIMMRRKVLSILALQPSVVVDERRYERASLSPACISEHPLPLSAASDIVKSGKGALRGR